MQVKLFLRWVRDSVKTVQKNWQRYASDYAIWQRGLKNKGRILAEQKTNAATQQNACPHRKGGIISDSGVYSHGLDRQYAVIKHKFPWGDIWIRCTRCNKWWKPGDADYEQALKFETNNVMSESMQFFLPKKNLALARELTKDS